MLRIHLDTKLAAEEYVATYGATYRRGKKPHLISASMHETSSGGVYHADINYRRADYGKPPEEFRHPDSFWGFLEEVGTLSDVVTSVYFDYPVEDWTSLFEVPSPLELSNFPLTHIEGYTLGRRAEDELEYTIHISQPRKHILHAVNATTPAMTFNRELIPQVLDEALKRSRALVHKGGSSHD